MQTTKDRERLIAAHEREISGGGMPRCALGLAALMTIALFGAALDPASPDLVARLEAQKGRLEVEQASVQSRNDVFQLRRATYERAVSPGASGPRATTMVKVSTDRGAR